MCGIAGFFGNFPQSLLEEMGKMISHRGPDGTGNLYVKKRDQFIGLMHRRLSILDLSTEGDQPITVCCPVCGISHSTSNEKKLWLIYNGELYNYLPLRKELENQGHRFHSNTDSEVLLHLYASEGAEMLKRLNGIFAFILFDGRENGQKHGSYSGDTLIARDGLGVKPLYYANTQAGLLFASELKALLAWEGLKKELDPVALHHYLSFLWCPAPKTALSSVKKFMPGEAMIIRNGQILKQWIYYDLPYYKNGFKYNKIETAKLLAQETESAVQRQLMADVPIGAFLSGGLDSSAIVAMMRKINPDKKIQCYTIGVDERQLAEEGFVSDLPYAKAVAQYLNVDLSIVNVSSNCIKDQLEKILFLLDEPQADPAPINVFLIAEQARKDGFKVLMSGTGGDDIFSGYRRHFAIGMEKYWTCLPISVRHSFANMANKLSEGSGSNNLGNFGFMRRLSKFLQNSDSPINERIVSYFFWGSENLRRSLYSQEMKKLIKNVETSEPLMETLRTIPDDLNPLDKMLYLEVKHFLADHNLNYTDKAGMAAGVEIRVPLIDLRMVDFAANVPPFMKQKFNQGKSIFKKAMEPYLPKQIIYRPKTGFGSPLRSWIHNELQDFINEYLSESSLIRRGVFDPKAVSNLIKLDKENKVNATYTIFSLLCIEIWCRKFIDQSYSSYNFKS